MSFTTLEKTFQDHVAMDSCWNIPTSIRMSIVGCINELHSASLNDTNKLSVFYETLQQITDQQPNSELETRQLISLKSFMQKHVWFDETAKKAIINDLSVLMAAEPLPA